MPKLTKDYESLQNVVIDALDNSNHNLRRFFQSDRDKRLRFEAKLQSDYKEATQLIDPALPYRRFSRKSVVARQFYGAIQPLADMYKDFTLSAPYKTWPMGWRDFLPVRIFWGAVNMTKGGLILAAIPVVLTLSIILNLPFLRKGPLTYLGQVGRSIGYASSWALDGVSHLIRGVTEVAFSPLTTFRMLFRSEGGGGGWHNMQHNQGYLQVLAEARESAKKLKTEDQSIPAPLFATLYELHRKVEKSKERCQDLGFNIGWNPVNEVSNFENLKSANGSVKQRVDNYLKLL